MVMVSSRAEQHVERIVDRIRQAALIACVPEELSVRDVIEIGDALLAAPVLTMVLGGLAAAEGIQALRERYGEHMVVGAYGITGLDTLDVMLAAGAQLVATPVVDCEALARCKAHGVLYASSVASFDEARAAVAVGVRCLRTTAMPSHLSLWQQAVPAVAWIAAGGIGAESLTAYARAGVAAVELSSALFPGPTWSQAQIIRTARSLRRRWEDATVAPSDSL